MGHKKPSMGKKNLEGWMYSNVWEEHGWMYQWCLCMVFGIINWHVASGDWLGGIVGRTSPVGMDRWVEEKDWTVERWCGCGRVVWLEVRVWFVGYDVAIVEARQQNPVCDVCFMIPHLWYNHLKQGDWAPRHGEIDHKWPTSLAWLLNYP